MVQDSHIQNAKHHAHAAVPMDRLASHVVDGLIVSTISNLLLAATLNEFRISYLLENWLNFFALGVLIVVSAVSILLLYHSLSISFFGRTVGKRLFHIRVVDIQTGGRISFSKAFFRQVLWLLSCLSVIPMIHALEDKGRTSWYDRWLGLFVKTEGWRYDAGPSENEVRHLRSIIGLVISVWALVIIKIGLSMISPVRTVLSSWRTSEVNEKYAAGCEVISQLHEMEPSIGRLELAASLYLGDTIDKDCLRTELMLDDEKREPRAYFFSKAMLSVEDDELPSLYARKLCDLENCSDTSPEVDLESKESLLSKLIKLRYALRYKELQSAKDLIESMKNYTFLGAFLTQATYYVAWGELDEKLLYEIENLTAWTVPTSRRVDLMSWMCGLRLDSYSHDCEAGSAPFICDSLVNLAELSDGSDLARSEVIADIKSCSYGNQARSNYAAGGIKWLQSLKLKIQHNTFARYFGWLEEDDSYLKEIRRDLYEAEDFRSMIPIIEKWESLPSKSLAVRSIGEQILKKSEALGLGKLQVEVRSRLLQKLGTWSLSERAFSRVASRYGPGAPGVQMRLPASNLSIEELEEEP